MRSGQDGPLVLAGSLDHGVGRWLRPELSNQRFPLVGRARRGGVVRRGLSPLPAPSRYQGLRPWTPASGAEPRHATDPHIDAAGSGGTPVRALGRSRDRALRRNPRPEPGAKPHPEPGTEPSPGGPRRNPDRNPGRNHVRGPGQNPRPGPGTEPPSGVWGGAPGRGLGRSPGPGSGAEPRAGVWGGAPGRGLGRSPSFGEGRGGERPAGGGMVAFPRRAGGPPGPRSRPTSPRIHGRGWRRCCCNAAVRSR